MNLTDLAFFSHPASGPPVTGLKMWFKANAEVASDGDRLGTITDQSGNANNGTQATAGSKPTYKTNVANGYAAYDFGIANATDQWVELGNFFSAFTEGEFFIVLRKKFDPSDADARSGGWYFGTLDSMPRYNYAGDGSFTGIRESFGSTVVKDIPYPSITLNAWHLYNVSSKASEFTTRHNGVQSYTTATNTVGWAATSALGRSKDVSAVFWYLRGQVAEVLFYDTVQTAGNRTLIQNYLLTKYALPVVQAGTLSITTNLIARWEADNVAGSDGDAIGTWSDQSGSSRDATQGTGANKPLLKLGVWGSKPVLRFDGVNDQLNFTYGAITTFTVFVAWNAKVGTDGYAGVLAWRAASVIGFQMTDESGNGNTLRPHLVVTNASNAETQNKTIPSEGLNLATQQRGRKIDVWRWDGTTVKMDLNGVSQVVSAGTGGYSTECCIGKSYAWITGDIAAILVYSAALSDADVLTVEAYLNAKYYCYW